jgi:hypothetical protein
MNTEHNMTTITTTVFELSQLALVAPGDAIIGGGDVHTPVRLVESDCVWSVECEVILDDDFDLTQERIARFAEAVVVQQRGLAHTIGERVVVSCGEDTLAGTIVEATGTRAVVVEWDGGGRSEEIYEFLHN